MMRPGAFDATALLLCLVPMFLGCGINKNLVPIVTTIRTDPPGARLSRDGDTISSQSPHVVRMPPPAFTGEPVELTASADGYEPTSVLLEFGWDSQCVARNAFEGILLGAILILPAAKLFSIPWCTKFEQDDYELELAPIQTPASTAASPLPDRSRAGGQTAAGAE